MTKTEVDRFRAVLTVRLADLERVSRRREAITVERSADQLEEIQAASQRTPWFVSSTANSTNFDTPVRLYAVIRKVAFRPARGAMRIPI